MKLKYNKSSKKTCYVSYIGYVDTANDMASGTITNVFSSDELWDGICYLPNVRNLITHESTKIPIPQL